VLDYVIVAAELVGEQTLLAVTDIGSEQYGIGYSQVSCHHHTAGQVKRRVAI